MNLFAWMGRGRGKKVAKKGGLVSREGEDIRLSMAHTQRELGWRAERFWERAEKRLALMAQRVRHFGGERGEVLALQAEQYAWQRQLDRMEVAEMDTAELLREWREWMRAVRMGETDSDSPRQQKAASCLPGQEVRERMEMVRSELRVRGVIEEGEGEQVSSIEYRVLSSPAGGGGEKQQDALSEWDQYLGERLPATARFWEGRVQETRAGRAHETIMHGLVKHMRRAHGQAKIWQRMQG